MIDVDFKMEVKLDRFGIISQETERLLDKVVRKCAFDLEKAAKALCPVDTGALRASIYVSTGKQSTFARAMAAAEAKNPNILRYGEDTEEVMPDGLLEAIVAVGVSYGVYVNFGTVFIAGDGFFDVAVETMRPVFAKAVAAALSGSS